MAKTKRPVVLTIAGSDNSCGAGAQADLKTFSAHECYGLTAITCVVAEVPGKVKSIQAVNPEILRDQIDLLLKAFPVAAVKTGMLYSADLIEVAASALQAGKKRGRFLVVDPVMVATSGARLLQENAVEDYKRKLFPLADLVTPNLDELCILAGVKRIDNLEEMKEAGRKLVALYGCAFLLKGGHLKSKFATDVLITKEEECVYSLPFIKGVKTHGTGCTYAAAIASNLAKKIPLADAVANGKRYITAAIQQHLSWGSTQALEHFPEF
ncbi:MAG: bifunctional hydroxymethylpyrimidine kinase/phosphomethylpyrimidine kinase [Chthoniobacterales bacterium]